MQIEILTRKDLEEFKQEILQALAAHNQPNLGKAKEWLRSKEVRQLLNVSSGTLQNLRVKRLLKPTKIGGVFYYQRTELEALLNAGTK